MKHPCNHGDGKGRITDGMGYGCAAPEFTEGFEPECGKPTVIFFDSGHGLCEMHEFVPANAKASQPAAPAAQVGSTDGLWATVPPTPTFEGDEKCQ